MLPVTASPPAPRSAPAGALRTGVESASIPAPRGTPDGATGLGGRVILSYGVLGVAGLLTQAICRLGPIAAEPLVDRSLDAFQGALYVAWAASSLYFEGYRAFQLRFCPRVVARAAWLAAHPTPLRVALAPLFCMGFFHARRATLALAWGTSAMVVGFVVALRHVAQPWRGIVDGGVVLALGWGLLTLLASLASTLAGRAPRSSPELPD